MSAQLDVLAVLEKHHHRAAFGPRPKEADELAECRAAIFDLIKDRRALAEALHAVITLDIRGHQLQDRLQFSGTGRAILAKIENARAALARAGGAT